jgi:hypothetical protein
MARRHTRAVDRDFRGHNLNGLFLPESLDVANVLQSLASPHEENTMHIKPQRPLIRARSVVQVYPGPPFKSRTLLPRHSHLLLKRRKCNPCVRYKLLPMSRVAHTYVSGRSPSVYAVILTFGVCRTLAQKAICQLFANFSGGPIRTDSCRSTPAC